MRLGVVARRLTNAGETVAVAETSAGGLIAASLLAQKGASKFFKGGVVPYSKSAKAALLGLDASTSAPTSTEPHALELAEAARAALGADWGVGETGVAGPTANSRGVAPGVCALGVVGPGGLRMSMMLWPDDKLSASDAYGQADKVPRREAMECFSAQGVALLGDALAQVHGGED